MPLLRTWMSSPFSCQVGKREWRIEFVIQAQLRTCKFSFTHIPVARPRSHGHAVMRGRLVRAVFLCVREERKQVCQPASQPLPHGQTKGRDKDGPLLRQAQLRFFPLFLVERSHSCGACRLLPLVMPGEGNEEPGQPGAFEHLADGMIEPCCPSEGSQR